MKPTLRLPSAARRTHHSRRCWSAPRSWRSVRGRRRRRRRRALLQRVPRRSPPSPSAPHGLYGQATWAAGAHAAPPITTLRDQSGQRFSLGSLHGHTVALVFFDSHCHQECPLEGRELAAAERASRSRSVPCSLS